MTKTNIQVTTFDNLVQGKVGADNQHFIYFFSLNLFFQAKDGKMVQDSNIFNSSL